MPSPKFPTRMDLNKLSVIWIYVAFGEHPAAGVCVCVCSSQLDSSGLVVWVLVCVSVYVGVSTCFLAWLVGCLCLCVLVCFQDFAVHFRALCLLLTHLLCFSCIWGGGLGTPL